MWIYILFVFLFTKHMERWTFLIFSSYGNNAIIVKGMLPLMQWNEYPVINTMDIYLSLLFILYKGLFFISPWPSIMHTLEWYETRVRAHKKKYSVEVFFATRPQKYANMRLAYDYCYCSFGKHNVGNKNNEYFEDDGSDLGLHVQYTCFIWCIIMWSIKIFCPKTIICFIAVLLLRQYSWPL